MARSFTKIVAFAFVLCFVFGIARISVAQDKEDWIKPITAKGSAAFLFSMNGLGSFGIGGIAMGDGLVLSGVGGKWYLADDLALRVLLALNHRAGDTTYRDTSSRKPSSTQFGVGAGVEMHFRPLYSTSPYVGAQISITHASTDGWPISGEGLVEETTSKTSFGIAVLAGFDWFATRGIAIGAEGALGFSSTSGSTTDTPTTGAAVTTNNQSLTHIFLVTSGGVHLVVFF